MRNKFGGMHTEHKLEKLEAYLKTYATALKHQHFRLIFFDAFAGTGDIEVGPEAPLLDGADDYSPFIKGSVQRALQLGTAFDEYVFVEKSRAKANTLKELEAQYPAIANRISIHCADGNEELLKFCSGTNWATCRAVVFLDPYGNQVKWHTLEAVAATGGIDLWYLFPAGLGVYRQIGNDARVDLTLPPPFNPG